METSRNNFLEFGTCQFKNLKNNPSPPLSLPSFCPQALVVLEYLVKAGSERVYQQCKENLFSIQTLKDFQYMDKDGKDQGSSSEFFIVEGGAGRVGCLCKAVRVMQLLSRFPVMGEFKRRG